MIKSIKISLIVLPVLLCLLTSCGGDNYEYDDHKHPLHRKSIVFITPMYYTSNLKKNIVDKEAYKINRYVIRENDIDTYRDDIYKAGKQQFVKIRDGMVFKIKDSYHVIPWGLQESFSNEYRSLILEDEDGLLSTIAEFEIKQDEWR